MKNFKKKISIIVFIILGIFFVYLGFKDLSKDQINQSIIYIKSLNFYLIILILILMFLAHIIRAARWKMLIDTMGYKVPLKNTFFATMIGYVVNAGVPRLGEIVKCTIITKYNQVSFEKLIGTVIIERLVDMIFLGFMFLLSFAFQYDIIIKGFNELHIFRKNMPNEHSSNLNWILIVAFILIGIFLYFKFKKIKKMIANSIIGFKKGLTSFYYLKQKTIFFIYSVLIWLIYTVSIYVGILTIKEANFTPQFSMAISALAFASIGMILTPGGIGSFALFIAKILVLNGCSYNIGYANGTIQWFIQFFVILLLGLISFILLPILNQDKQKSI